MFVDLFIFFFCCCHFCFLLNTAAWTPPCRKAQYGSVCKSESGGHETEKQGRTTRRNLAHDGSQRASFGDRRDFFFLPPLLSFPFSCMVSRLQGSTPTLLLTQPLRDGCNSSLSMAPVIEPSERKGEGENEKESVGEGGRENKGKKGEGR